MHVKLTPILVAIFACVLLTAPISGHAGSLGVNIQLNGYLPAPPGVHIYYESGRPYYVEHRQRVYLKKRDKEYHDHDYDHDHGKKKGHKKHHRD